MPTLPELGPWVALEAVIAGMVFDPPMMVIPPNATFEEPFDEYGPAPHILVADLRNDTQSPTIDGDDHILSGTLVMTIRWPVARPWSQTVRDMPHSALLQLARPVVEGLPNGASFYALGVCVSIIKRPDILPPEIDGQYRLIRVRVPWWASITE